MNTQTDVARPNVALEGLARPDIFGWFDDADQTTPAHDPGLETICPVCAKTLSRPLKTISLMLMGAKDRSYFFRAHKACWDGLSEEEQSDYEGSLIDRLPDGPSTMMSGQ